MVAILFSSRSRSISTRSWSGLVFTPGEKNYFARVGQLELLVGRYSGRATAAAEVRNELRIGAEAHPELVHVVAADWIAWRSVETVEGLAVFGSVLSVVGERARVEHG